MHVSSLTWTSKLREYKAFFGTRPQVEKVLYEMEEFEEKELEE